MCNTSTSGLDTWDSNPDEGMKMFFFTTLPRIPLTPNRTPIKRNQKASSGCTIKLILVPFMIFGAGATFFTFCYVVFTSETAPGSMPTK